MRSVIGFGVLVCLLGLAIEFIGIASLVSNRLRMTLPFKSPPFALQSIGAILSIIGVFIVFLSDLFR